jgi:hypothetical protein
MADVPVVHMGENSPEQIAFKLMEQIAIAEDGLKGGRKGILDTYAECLMTVHFPHDRHSRK